MRLGVIDIGTNTTRLLVAEATAQGIRDLDRRLIFTRLGEGVDAAKEIGRKGAERTLRTVAEFCAICGEFGVEKLRVAGTSALRDAANREGFLSDLGELTGVPAEVLSGKEEANLTFLGATSDLEEGLFLVCDIGGGSTEFILGSARGEVRGHVSFDIGGVRLTERHLLSDPPATEEILLMEHAIDSVLDAALEALPHASEARFVGVAGTVTSLAALELGQDEYDPNETHHMRLTRSAVDGHYRALAAKTLEDLKQLPSLPPGRADVIVAGTSILSRSMALWGFSEVTVSEKDILDGLVLDLI